MHVISDGLYQAGEFQVALLPTQELFDYSLETFGYEHISTIHAGIDLGTVLSRLQRYGEAETILVEALGYADRILGEEHGFTVFGTNELAEVYNAQGNYSQGEVYYLRGLQVRERALGVEHISLSLIHI